MILMAESKPSGTIKDTGVLHYLWYRHWPVGSQLVVRPVGVGAEEEEEVGVEQHVGRGSR